LSVSPEVSDGELNNERPISDSDKALNKNLDTDSPGSSISVIKPFQRFFHDEQKIKRIFKFSIQDWRRMVSTLTGKRLSFKASFSDNLSLRLQETGKVLLKFIILCN
jgi:hypothetical protein